ncbi:MAG: PQQ-binding-like beta-propeller repeat protein [Planctomycetaceae bacterium]|nr:PQQ-binding-like beta-propeller repeat protein [Planctomycetaceae bacterium]
MIRRLCGVLVLTCLANASLAEDWSWWRGPGRDGIASAEQTLPREWSDEQGIAWQTPVPGRGHGSVIVIGDRLYLTTAEAEREARSLLCLRRDTGEQVWSVDVHRGNPTPFKNKKGSDASCTPACDGERLFVNFLHGGQMVTSAVSLDGKVLWQQPITDYIVHQAFGSSPAVYGPLVIVSADNKSGGAVAGLDRETGEIVWRQERPATPNYASPIILNVCGRDQLLLTGCDLVSSFEPLTGKKLWEIEGATTECVTSTVVCGELMFSSGGYPRNHVAAIRCDGSGKVVWDSGTRVYVPSLLVKEGHLYGVTDAGVAMCWNCTTGEEQWKGRLGGTFSSSPVLVGEVILVVNEEGQAFEFRARPDEFELLSENQLGDECFSTPTVCDGQIYVRVAKQTDDAREEFVWCIGQK